MYNAIKTPLLSIKHYTQIRCAKISDEPVSPFELGGVRHGVIVLLRFFFASLTSRLLFVLI